ncbi:MAG TPA: hypothetical protein VKF17_16660 [Isosphaeraceae bacterium]|nr:hypothetical protein [Isosphaeraceae bacterium]
MHVYTVGQLYAPSRRSWPEQSDYNYRAGGHELRIFLGRATPNEIAAVKKGRVEFGLMVKLPEIFVVARFHGPDGKVVLSFDCSYQWHRTNAVEPTGSVEWKETNPATRALCSIILVEATNGVILVLREMSYSPEFTRAIHRAISDQAALPYDEALHAAAVADIARRLNTDQLWDRCAVRCEGGA